MLSAQELERYRRQIAVSGIGEAGQEKLKRAKVFLAGAGGLGSPAALYLAAAGVGALRIADADSVGLSNLNRQVLHWTRDLGKLKVDSARRKLRALNPQVKIETFATVITESNVLELVGACGMILDAVDNLETRYLLNRAAVGRKIPLFHGAISGLEGRAMTVLPGQSACLMCLYRGAVVKTETPVIGATAAVIASIQATEALKYITGNGRLLAGRFLVYDGLNMRFDEIKVSRDPECPVCGPGGGV